jgi:glutamate synthase domain-containing protein 2
MILTSLNRIYPVRYTVFIAACACAVLGLPLWVAADWGFWVFAVGAALSAIGVYDLRQTHHAILRNYPVIGHLRFMLEYIRPEMRQYFIESDIEAAPFSRAQRSVVYARAKNISAMSFGALSANAILALNAGAKEGKFAHDTGEGSISRYHTEHGGDLIWQIASGYFGCRTSEGQFDP